MSGKDFEFKSQQVWHKEVSEGSVNFAYMSDCAVIYSNCLSHLLEMLSSIFGAAITFGAPIRAGVTLGALHHSEWIERPGMGVSLYGGSLTRAVELERAVKGAGMRIWLEPEMVKLARSIGWDKKVTRAKCGKPAELKWWLDAYEAGKCPRKTESAELKWQFDRWFTEKYTKDWFAGPNCKHTKGVVRRAVAELEALGR